MNKFILSWRNSARADGAGMTPHVILTPSAARRKDLKLRILRSCGVFAPQDDENGVIRSLSAARAKDLAPIRAGQVGARSLASRGINSGVE